MSSIHPSDSASNVDGTNQPKDEDTPRSLVRRALSLVPPPITLGPPLYSWVHEFLRAWSAEDSVRPRPQRDLVAPRLFYRVYSEQSAIRSKHYVSPDDVALARINADSIPPPHTVASIRRYLCSHEGFDAEGSTLFLKRSNADAAEDVLLVSILRGVGAGSSIDQPLALVVKVDHEAPAPRFRIKAKQKWTAPRGYLSYEEGEILSTDGIDDIPQGSIRLWKAQKAKGKIGWINPRRFDIL